MSASRANSRNVVVLTAGNILPLLASLGTAPILANALGAIGRGELAASVAPLVLAAAGLTLGAPEAITYFTARGQTGFWRAMLYGWILVVPAGLLGVAAIIALAPYLSDGDEAVTSLIGLAALALPIALIVYCVRGYARGQQAWTLVAFEQGITSLFRIVAISILAVLGALTVPTATAITAVAVFVGVFAYLPLIRMIRKNSAPAIECHQSVRPKQFLSYSSAVWLGAAAGILLAKLDLLLILPLSSAYALGIYVVAVSLADVIRVFNVSVREVVFSAQAKVTDDAVLARAARVSNGITAIAGVLIVCMSIPLVPLVFGGEFADSVPVLAVLVVGIVLGNPGSVMAAGLSARGRPLLRSLALLFGLFIDVILLFVLVPTHGAMGAAVASACANVCTGALIMIMGRSTFGLKIHDHIWPRRDDVKYVQQAALRMTVRRGEQTQRSEPVSDDRNRMDT